MILLAGACRANFKRGKSLVISFVLARIYI